MEKKRKTNQKLISFEFSKNNLSNVTMYLNLNISIRHMVVCGLKKKLDFHYSVLRTNY